jgi:hypothetical protein
VTVSWGVGRDGGGVEGGKIAPRTVKGHWTPLLLVAEIEVTHPVQPSTHTRFSKLHVLGGPVL